MTGAVAERLAEPVRVRARRAPRRRWRSATARADRRDRPIVRLQNGRVDLARARRRRGRPTPSGSGRRSMSRRPRRSPAPRGRLRSIFARPGGRAAAPRSVRWRQSYQTPAARSRPAGSGGRLPAPHRARWHRARRRPIWLRRPRRAGARASRSVAISYSSFRIARPLDDAFGQRRAPRPEARRRASVAVSHGSDRRSGAPPRSRCGAADVARAAAPGSASYEPSTVTSARSGHSAVCRAPRSEP